MNKNQPAALMAAAVLLALAPLALLSPTRVIQGVAESPFPAQYVPVVPARILDTRDGTGGHTGALGPGQTLTVMVAGGQGLPHNGISAAVLNVTASNPSEASFLTVYPSGQSLPSASNLNFAAGQTISNLATVSLGADGAVTVFNSAGGVDIVVDAEGYYRAPISGTSGLFRPLPPTRILDTRNGSGHASALEADQVLTLEVAGRGGVPATGVLAVVLNVLAINGSQSSFLTVYPSGLPARPHASNVNFPAARNIPNRVVARLGAGGQVDIYNSAGRVDVAADVAGWYTDGSDAAAAGGAFTGVTPERLLDTRSGLGGAQQQLAGSFSLNLQVTGRGGVPTGAGSVVINLTATQPSIGSYLTVYPGGSWLPIASDLNVAGGQTLPNAVVAKLGPDGSLGIYNALGGTQVLVDVLGYFSQAPSQTTPPGAPLASAAAAVSRSEVSVSWTPPTQTGSGALVSYAVIGQPGGRQWAVDGAATQTTVGSLSCGVAFTFQVAAISLGAGGGPASAPSAAVTPPCPTSNVISDVPWIHQAYALSCEEAALRMALAHQGIGVNEDQVLAAIGVDRRSAYWDAQGLRWGNPYTSFVGNPSGSESDLSGYGTYHTTIARAAQAFGGHVLRSGEGIAPQDVYQSLLEGHPVEVWVTWDWSYRGRQDYVAFDGQRVLYAGPLEHAVTLAGVSPDSVLVNDPLRSQYWMARSTFESAYASYNNMAVIFE